MLAQQRAFTANALGAQRHGAVGVRVSSAGRLAVYARESRIGIKPIPLPKGVTVAVDGTTLKVKGPLGALEQRFTPYVKFEQKDGVFMVLKAEESRIAMAQHGLTRSLTANMVTGVSTGFKKTMELVGTGYRASVAGKDLTLNVGYSKPRILPIPEGLTVKVEKNTTLVISGSDKVMIGDFAATVRRQREPEPYKGKGVRYQGEVIKLKEGKAGGKKK